MRIFFFTQLFFDPDSKGCRFFPPTFNFEVHAPKDQRTNELCLHLPLKVNKDGGQVVVGIVRDAGGGDGLEEFCLRELSGQGAQMLVNEGAQRDAGKLKKNKTKH